MNTEDFISAEKHFHAENKGPHVLISAGVHGDEYEPILAALELAGILENILRSGEVTIVPIVNTTAFKKNSRYGEDGLDLARICPGKHSGTASEKAAASISEKIRNADYFIDMHTGGRLFYIFPLAGYMIHPSQDILEKQRRMADAFQLPVIWGTDSTPNGRTLSVARDANIPAIYIEYGGGGQASADIVKSLVNGCMNILTDLQMIPASGDAKRIKKYWVEDHVPDSGHLQSKMPSPAAGVFVPAVKSGEKINKGQLWGHVVDPENGKKYVIPADKDGIVLFIRVSAVVKKDDALGGILPAGEQDRLIIISHDYE